VHVLARRALVEVRLRLMQLRNDLLRRVSLCRHRVVPLLGRHTLRLAGTSGGGQVTSNDSAKQKTRPVNAESPAYVDETCSSLVLHRHRVRINAIRELEPAIIDADRQPDYHGA
jgi:hypothetical protein